MAILVVQHEHAQIKNFATKLLNLLSRNRICGAQVCSPSISSMFSFFFTRHLAREDVDPSPPSAGRGSLITTPGHLT